MAAQTDGPARLAFDQSLRRLRARMAAERDLEDVLDTAFDFRGVGEFRRLNPIQRRAEVRELAGRVAGRDPETVVEIGTCDGGTFYVWCRALPADTLVSIDLPGGQFGGGYSAERAAFYRAFAPDADVQTIRRDSHDSETVERLRTVLDGRGIDFLFLDGDHSYDGVKQDFETYGALVPEGGVVAIHDILPQPHRRDSSVCEFWHDVEVGRDTEEIVSARHERWGGLGLIYM